MLRLRTILPRVRTNVCKLYCKAIEELKPVLNKDLESQKKELQKDVTGNVKEEVQETSFTIIEPNLYVPIAIESQAFTLAKKAGSLKNELPKNVTGDVKEDLKETSFTIITPNLYDPIAIAAQASTAEKESVCIKKKEASEVPCGKIKNSKPMRGKKSGQSKSPGPPKGPESFGGNYIVDKCGIYNIPRPNTNKWRNISYALVPFALGLSVVILTTRGEGEKPEYIPYEYMYMRTKRFPWGDGKSSLFHGPYNIIPEEEEEFLDRELEEREPPATPPENDIPPDPAEPRYQRHDEREDKLKARERHAKEELERRKRRHEAEAH